MSYVPEHLSFYFQLIVISQNQLAYSIKLRSTIITWTYLLEFLHILDSINGYPRFLDIINCFARFLSCNIHLSGDVKILDRGWEILHSQLRVDFY